MSKKLTLNLSATDIKLAVKSDSYITGQIDKSADMVKNAALAFNEQAGDETYHEMKLYRTMKGALAKLEAQIAEYVETSDPNAAITDTLTSSAVTTFKVEITVGNRMSNAFVTTMAYLAQEYIINALYMVAAYQACPCEGLHRLCRRESDRHTQMPVQVCTKFIGCFL